MAMMYGSRGFSQADVLNEDESVCLVVCDDVAIVLVRFTVNFDWGNDSAVTH